MQCVIDGCERKGEKTRGGRCQRCYAERNSDNNTSPRINNKVPRTTARRNARDEVMGVLYDLALDAAVKDAVRVQAAGAWLRNELEGSDDDSLESLRLRIDTSIEYAKVDTEEESSR